MDLPEERVSILEPVIAKTHTTFYNKQQQPKFVMAQSPEDYIVKPREAIPKKQWSEDNMNMPSERVSILEPVIAKTHTTFYNKQHPHSFAQQGKYLKDLPAYAQQDEDTEPVVEEEAAPLPAEYANGEAPPFNVMEPPHSEDITYTPIIPTAEFLKHRPTVYFAQQDDAAAEEAPAEEEAAPAEGEGEGDEAAMPIGFDPSEKTSLIEPMTYE